MLKKISYYWIVLKFLQKRTVRFLKNLLFRQNDFEKEIEKENFILKNAAQRLGIQVKDWDGGMLELQHQGKTTYIKGNTTEIESAISHKIAGDKYLVAKILKKNNLPVPRCECFTLASIDQAIHYFIQIKQPVVVKPRRGTSGGTGVTAGISNLKDFRRSFYEASLFDKYILVEEFVPGENIRLLILEDQLLSAVKRIPAYIKGDGRSSIKKLIKETNRQREHATSFPKLWPILINNDLHLTLKRQKLSLRTVLP
ncbi:MAG TPA: ATP-grasp domain-containing protein, partial [Caldithrix sp.]|nr:ATP-grasp domain-containing protein [Caldithrix sp.]